MLRTRQVEDPPVERDRNSLAKQDVGNSIPGTLIPEAKTGPSLPDRLGPVSSPSR